MLKKLLNKKMKVLKNQQGLTLIELLVVIVILGIIAAVAIPMVMGNSADAAKNTNEQNAAILQDAINRFKTINNGSEPSDVMDATDSELLKAAKGGPYLEFIPTPTDCSSKAYSYTEGKVNLAAACLPDDSKYKTVAE